ncbi:hypothetical protein VD659_08455 [Herbiconiux sp. 11R-BC]
MSRNPFVVLGAVFLGVLVLAGGLFLLVGQDSTPSPSGGSAAAQGPAPSGPARTSDEAVSFAISDGALVPDPSGPQQDAATQAAADAYWARFSLIAGDAAASVTAFSLYDDPDDTSEASVARDDGTASAWDLQVNAAWAADSGELDHTLVHEFGHLLSLSPADVAEVTGACPTLQLSEGCARPGSAIAAFQERFWSGLDVGTPGGTPSDSEVTAFYQANGGSDSFVSEYAATNLTEDVAESWAAYVLSATPGFSYRDASGSAVWSQKVRFFDGFPALVSERERIRGALGL